ncbi:hypothetical protein [Nocardia sp. MW-W600-9]
MLAVFVAHRGRPCRGDESGGGHPGPPAVTAPVAACAPAADVVARVREKTKDHGQATTGTRTDDRRERSNGGRYVGSTIVSTFAEPSRARWVLLFYRGSDDAPFAGNTVEKNMPTLIADVASFPLGWRAMPERWRTAFW